jgi:predicted phage terminase large subunit-like protein
MNDDARIRAIRWACNIRAFAQEALGIQLEPFHIEWLNAAQAYKNLLLIAPVGHGKSYIIGYIYPLWRILNDPKLRVLIVSNSIALARDDLSRIRRAIESEVIEETYGDLVGEKWTDTEMRLSTAPSSQKEATVKACGTGSTVEGFRYDIGICDDMLDIKSQVSEVERASIEMWFENTYAARAEPTAQRITIGTPWHVDDHYAREAKKQGTVTRIYKAVQDDGSFLWSSRWSSDKLAEQRAEMGELAYTQKFLCQPTSSAGNRFKSELKFETAEPWERKTCVMGVDLAISEKTQADYFVICAAISDAQGRWHIKFVKGHYLFPQQVKAIIEAYERYHPSYINIESVAYQTAMAQHIRAEYPHLPIRELKQTKDKVMRLDGLAPFFEQGRIIVDKADEHTNDFIAEYINFPNAKHDDMLDALEMAIRGAARAPVKSASSIGGSVGAYKPSYKEHLWEQPGG